MFVQWCSYVLDIINTKILKPSHVDNHKTKSAQKIIFTVIFCNKGMEQINLNRILKCNGSITRLPGIIQLQENIPVVYIGLHQQ